MGVIGCGDKYFTGSSVSLTVVGHQHETFSPSVCVCGVLTFCTGENNTVVTYTGQRAGEDQQHCPRGRTFRIGRASSWGFSSNILREREREIRCRNMSEIDFRLILQHAVCVLLLLSSLFFSAQLFTTGNILCELPSFQETRHTQCFLSQVS